MTRKSLSDILQQGDRESLSQAWGTTEAAEDFAPLPKGEYVARIESGELFTSEKKGTPGYKLCFRVLEGECAQRRFWHDVWLTPAALAMAKRDLAKLRVTSLEQLENPLPPGIRCRAKLTLRQDDDGNEYNRVKRFEVVGIDPPETDAFAPKTAADQETAEGAKGEPAAGGGAESTDEQDEAASFDPAKIEAETKGGDA